MAKVTIEYESKYDNGDVVIFKAPNNKYIYVGIIEGYTIDDRVFRFNIRTSHNHVFTYLWDGGIPEYDIIDKLEGELQEKCMKEILNHD